MDEVKVIKCPICSNERCYEDSHVEEDIEVTEGLCYDCGYTSTSKYTVEASEKYESTMPAIVVQLKIQDHERHIFGYPSMMQTTEGYIFPEPIEEDWYGFSAPVVEIEEKDMDKLPPGSEGKVGDLVIALWLGERYDKFEFYKACENIGLMIDESDNGE